MIKIDPHSKAPLYKQITDYIERSVHDGSLTAGKLLPSMNELAAELGISKETVKKAYGYLSGKGIIEPKQGKGFYVADQNARTHLQVLLIFDRLSLYKQMLLDQFQETLGPDAEITILNHNQSVDLLAYYLDNNLDRGTRLGLKNVSYNMDSAAGLLYTVDVSKPEGERVQIQSMADGTPFSLDREYRVAINSYRGNGGGELITRGAGIPHSELKSRILTSTDKDLRFYLMQRIQEQKTVTPRKLNHWRFVPDEWAPAALERDRKILFPNTRYQ